MGSLFHADHDALILGIAVFFLLSVMQALHLVALFYRTVRHNSIWPYAKTMALIVHLVLMGWCCNAAAHGWKTMLAMDSPLAMALWLDVPAAAIFIADSLIGRRPFPAALGVWLFLFTPLALASIGSAAAALVAADALLFSFLSAFQLADDARRRTAGPSRLAFLPALKRMPAGLAIADGTGRIIMVNDALRITLGLLTTQAHALGTIGQLEQVLHEHSGCSSPEATRDDLHHGGLIIGHDDEQGNRRFSMFRCCLLGDVEHMTAVMAFDVTEEEQARLRIQSSLDALQRSERQLQDALQSVHQAARQQAALAAKARVHDVIGQRLSLITRILEDDRLDDDTIGRLLPLLEGIGKDLHCAHAPWRSELESIVESFALVGVAIDLHLEVEPDDDIGNAIAVIARESTTNAIRHGGASRVEVTLRTDGDLLVLHVEDDGTRPPSDRYREGTGIASMRRAVQQAGGVFVVDTAPSFALKAMFRPRSAHAVQSATEPDQGERQCAS